MSDYTNTYNGAGKDAASSIIFGSDLDTQFNAIASMSATKADKVLSATADNVAKLDVAGNLVDSGYSFPNLVGTANPTAAEFNILSGATITTAELNLLSGKTGTIWTSDNDGAASGLDADTVDGKHLSDLDARYINVSGDTMTGNLYVPFIQIGSTSQDNSNRIAHIISGSLSNDAKINFGYHNSSYTTSIWNIGRWGDGTFRISNFESGTEDNFVRISPGGSITFRTTLVIDSANTANDAIELGSTTAATTPYINFHSGATATDYDARIIASGGTGTAGGGSLDISAATLTFNNNTVWHNGNTPKSFTTNGYQKLPSGLIIQWGKASQTTTAAQGPNSVTFPIAFPTACLSVNATDARTNYAMSIGSGGGLSYSTTGFEWWQEVAQTNQIFWIAIGY